MTDPQAASSPAATIGHLAQERRAWPDGAVLQDLAALPPLADEAALNGPTGDWSDVYRFVALAEVCAERRLRAAVPLLLDRAAFGDPGETMRGLRHHLEQIAGPDWDFLADACLHALRSPRPGTRLWAAEQLAVLQIDRTVEALQAALEDPEDEVRAALQSALDALRPPASHIRRQRRR